MKKFEICTIFIPEIEKCSIIIIKKRSGSMNLKGIKISKKMYKKLNEIGVSNLKNNMLRGLDEFKKFTWSSFVKQEFDSFINCIKILDENGIFPNINDKQLFIINYYTDVTEMDIVTVLSDDENRNVIIDVEYKSGEEAAIKLDEQINKRVTDHMRQLFLNEKYVIIGMNDDGFYKANYYDSETNIEINSLSELSELMSNFFGSDIVENVLTQANDLAGIHKLYSEMENGTFKYYEETKKTTEYIMEKISEGKKALVCMSKPGTGKTVVAFKLFFENENTLFLIMNQKFYNSLGLTKYFVEGRCFYGSDTFLNQDLSDKIVIIDEVQRLSKEYILEVIQNSKATILFGDTGQSFMINDLELNSHQLIKYLKDNGIYVQEKELKRSKRYNDTVEKSLNYLTNRNMELKEKIKLEDYNINIYYDISDFLTAYYSCKDGKRLYTTYDFRDEPIILIGDKKFIMAERDFYQYSISVGYENYIGHTLHAISFDVENNFVYLKNVKISNIHGKDILTKEGCNTKDEESITKFLNELNILFTRGKKSLNIYTSDFEVYLYLSRKLKEIL